MCAEFVYTFCVHLTFVHRILRVVEFSVLVSTYALFFCGGWGGCLETILVNYGHLKCINSHWQVCFRGILYIYIRYLNLSKVIHHIVLFRYSKRHLWEQFFYTLLNVESCEKLPDLSELRHLVEAEILSYKPFSDLTHVRNILGGKWKKLVNWTLMIDCTPKYLRSLNCGHFGFCQLNVILKCDGKVFFRTQCIFLYSQHSLNKVILYILSFLVS
jgi:hypothetical protein